MKRRNEINVMVLTWLKGDRAVVDEAKALRGTPLNLPSSLPAPLPMVSAIQVEYILLFLYGELFLAVVLSILFVTVLYLYLSRSLPPLFIIVLH